MPYDNVPFILIQIAFLALFIGAILLAFVRSRQAKEAFRTLALRTGMQLEEGNFFVRPKVNGQFKGRKTSVYNYSVRSGRSRKTYTAVTMEVGNPGGYTFTLRREHALDGLGKHLGMKDLTVGDSEFDSKFVVKSKPEILLPEMIRRYGNLRDMLLRVPNIRVDLQGTTLRHHESGYQPNIDTLTNILEILAGIADAMEESEGAKGIDSSFDSADEFASNTALDPSLAADPFYSKTSKPEDEYPYDPVMAPSSGGGVSLRMLILVIAAISMLAAAGIMVFLLGS